MITEDTQIRAADLVERIERDLAKLRAVLQADAPPQLPPAVFKPPPAPPDRFLTPNQAAVIARRSRSTVINWASVFGVGHKVAGRQWAISERKLRALLAGETIGVSGVSVVSDTAQLALPAPSSSPPGDTP